MLAYLYFFRRLWVSHMFTCILFVLMNVTFRPFEQMPIMFRPYELRPYDFRPYEIRPYRHSSI